MAVLRAKATLQKELELKKRDFFGPFSALFSTKSSRAFELVAFHHRTKEVDVDCWRMLKANDMDDGKHTIQPIYDTHTHTHSTQY